MENMTTTSTGIKTTITRGPITLDKIYKGDFQKPGTMTAQLRQLVTTKSEYPSRRTQTELQANVFSSEEFGFESQEFTSTETRIAWLLVPENATEDQVKAKLVAANVNNAVIYRILSNQPILDENQKYAISNPSIDASMDTFANAQAVRYPENENTIADGTAGKLTLDKQGRVQYRKTFFWNSPLADIDQRGKSAPYLSAELQAELAGAGVMQGQEL